MATPPASVTGSFTRHSAPPSSQTRSRHINKTQNLLATVRELPYIMYIGDRQPDLLLSLPQGPQGHPGKSNFLAVKIEI